MLKMMFNVFCENSLVELFELVWMKVLEIVEGIFLYVYFMIDYDILWWFLECVWWCYV